MTQDHHSPPIDSSSRTVGATASPQRTRSRKSQTPRRGRTSEAVPAAIGDDTAARCRAWLGHHAEACRLSLEWGQVEARLQDEYGWYKMSKKDRERHPGQAELDAIQDRLSELDQARDELLPTLAGLPAVTPETVALKLSVVAELVDVADFPEAHALVVRAREEMLAL